MTHFLPAGQCFHTPGAVALLDSSKSGSSRSMIHFLPAGTSSQSRRSRTFRFFQIWRHSHHDSLLASRAVLPHPGGGHTFGLFQIWQQPQHDSLFASRVHFPHPGGDHAFRFFQFHSMPYRGVRRDNHGLSASSKCGDWGDRVKSLRKEFRGPGFDVACELVLNFLGGEEEQSQQEISSRTGVPQPTVSRHIGAVRTRVGQLFRRPRAGG
jgi:hypothetical protein